MNRALRLTHKRVIEVEPTAPFNFDATFHKPDHFPSSDNVWQPGIRWQTMLWQCERLGLKFENRGTTAKPCVHLSVWSREKLERAFVDELIAEIVYRYNLKLDLTDFNRRFRDDLQLGPIVRRWRGMRPFSAGSLYEYLVIAIMLQNCTVRRSVKMMQALYEKYGIALKYDGRTFYCMWSPDEMNRATEQELRELKVGYRAKSLKRVTAAFAGNGINEIELRSKTREEQRNALLELYGIGPASVGYILFDVFHHWDEMDHISPWEQKIYSKLFFDRDPEKPISAERLMRLFVKRFSGYRMLAVHYIWEDLFWKRQHAKIEWLEKLIRL